jgi:hypothetical protein
VTKNIALLYGFSFFDQFMMVIAVTAALRPADSHAAGH